MDLTKPYQNITYKVGATNRQLQRAIEAAVPAAIIQMKDKSAQFRGVTRKDTARKIFDFLKNEVRYKVDGDNQKIKLPSALLREREGDCKSYALFTAAVLSNLKIPYKFTYASYKPGDPTPEHIYVTLQDGTIIDAVWGKFNSEKRANYKFNKPMNISYISGIKGHKKEYKAKKHHIGGPIGCDCKDNYKGLGRTGLDWWKAVNGNSYKSPFSWTLKENSPINIAVRWIIREIFRKNAGGIANFFWRISPFNSTPVIDTQKKAFFDAAVAELNKEMAAKYGAGAGPASSTTSQIKTVTIKDASGKTYTVNVAIDANAQANIAQQEAYAKEYAAKYAALRQKYWWIIRPASSGPQQKAYRNLEVKYFDLGGNPDDLNNAIMEGNTKTPVGKTFNYWLNKVAHKQNPGIGLGIRAMTSALLTGQKFQLGDTGAYDIAIAGTSMTTGIGTGEPVSTTAALAVGGTGAAIWTESTVIACIGLVGTLVTTFWGNDYQSTPMNTNDNGIPTDSTTAGGGLLGGDNTILYIGGAAIAAYFLMGDKKK